MRYEEKNPPTVYETEDGTETRERTSQASGANDTTMSATGQGKIPLKIEHFLMRGSKNALTKERLQRMTGLVPRKVTQAVQDARRRGVPVLSSSHPGGYFIAATEEEKQRFVRSLRHRAKETSTTLYCLERAKVEESENG